MTEGSSQRKRRHPQLTRWQRFVRWPVFVFAAWGEYTAWQDYTRLDRAELATLAATPTAVVLRGMRSARAVVMVDGDACPSIEFPRSQAAVLRRMSGYPVAFTVERTGAEHAACLGWSAEAANHGLSPVPLAEVEHDRKVGAGLLIVAWAVVLGAVIWRPRSI